MTYVRCTVPVLLLLAARRIRISLPCAVFRFLVSGCHLQRYRHSAYVFIGGLPFELTEGDVLAVCSQYGEIVHIDLVRDPETNTSRGFAFVAYEDQRSTVLAVDNLSGTKVGGRVIQVQHVDNYRKKKQDLGLAVEDERAEDEEDLVVEADEEEDINNNNNNNNNKAAGAGELTQSKAPVPSWRDLVARRDAVIKEKEGEKKTGKDRHSKKRRRAGTHDKK
jgi:RNA-binding motif X-linked protein 2